MYVCCTGCTTDQFLEGLSSYAQPMNCGCGGQYALVKG